ncbi:MAG: septation protein SepH [Ancrocorticia sp.]
MIKLQLLGLQPDGEHLTLNDAGGNRYSLPITDDLRAALRRDVSSTEKVTETVRQMSPREIQALVREGLTVSEICEVGALPPGRVSVLAHPIIAEREHMARRAQALVMGHEVGSMTLDELVTSRLVARGVNIAEISWDTIRKPAAPWTLTLDFSEDGAARRATWTLDLERKSIEENDDEARSLSEHQVATVKPPVLPPVSSSTARIDDVLAALDAQRGTPQPVPSLEDLVEDDTDPSNDSVLEALVRSDDESEQDASGGADAESEKPSEDADDDAGEAASERPKLSLAKPIEDDSSEESEGEVPNEDAEAEQEADKAERLPETPEELAADLARRKKGNRPSMPSWDEVLFGKKD